MRSCLGPACDVAWLDPRPIDEDLGLAYAGYYTHGGAPRRRSGRLGRMDAVLYRKVSGIVGRMAGVDAERARSDVLYLDRRPPGVLLDVGCGDGEVMRRLERLGWRALGTDPDARAVDAARARGLDARRGHLEEVGLAEASVDAITMRHVVEHLPDPRGTLAECRRLLRPRGCLVLSTPNVRSLGHRLFGAAWRGLEPPRHLQLFSPRALGILALEAGFDRVEAFSSAAGAEYILDTSIALRRLRRGRPRHRRQLFRSSWVLQTIETLLRTPAREIGEEAVVIAHRDR
jgi:SAM-dependent methyltransferase